MVVYSNDPNCRNLKHSRGITWADAGYVKYEPCACQFCEGLDRSVFVTPVFISNDSELPVRRSALTDAFGEFGKIVDIRISGMKTRFKPKNAVIR